MKQEEASKLLFAEYEKTHSLFWSLFNKFSTAVITLTIIPYVRPEITEKLGAVIYAFPIISFIVSICCTWILASEYQRVKMIKNTYEKQLGKYCPCRMPKETIIQKIIALPIGPTIICIFGISSIILCLLNTIALNLVERS